MRLLLALMLTIVLIAPLRAQEQYSNPEFEAAVKRYLMDNPEVLIEALQSLQARQTQDDEFGTAEQIQAALLNAPGDPIGGNPDGDVNIVEFFDYQCGFCKRMYADLMRNVEKDGNVRLIFKEFPILSPVSHVAARAALAARLQDLYEPMHDGMMRMYSTLSEDAIFALAHDIGADIDRLRRDMQSAAVNDVIDRNRRLAKKLNIHGTPATLIGRTFFPGALDYDQITKAIEAARSSETSS